jgi:putative addiction module component (TIGR02574 family)
MTIEEVLDYLLRLPDDLRADIAMELVASLVQTEDDEEIDEALIAEIERRRSEIADGRAQTIPWETVHARLLKKLEQMREGGPSS